jgi:type IV pilus assembly protein PilE
MLRKKGFTLIEVLIVVIILGILATLALPQFTKTVERAKRSEALTNIAAVQTGLKIYVLEQDGDYTDATLGGLDSEITEKYWAITISGLGVGTYTITATRDASAHADYASKTLIIDQDGDWSSSTYPFVPS